MLYRLYVNQLLYENIVFKDTIISCWDATFSRSKNHSFNFHQFEDKYQYIVSLFFLITQCTRKVYFQKNYTQVCFFVGPEKTTWAQFVQVIRKTIAISKYKQFFHSFCLCQQNIYKTKQLR